MRQYLFWVAATFSCVIGGNAWTQDDVVSHIPVFRYALQSWQPDEYDLFIIYDDGTTLGNMLDKIQRARSNTKMFPVSVDEMNANPKIKAAHDQAKISSYPAMILRYPNVDGPAGHAWAGALSDENIDRLFHSPAQRQLTKKLVAGDSIVWVLIDDKHKALRRGVTDLAAQVHCVGYVDTDAGHLVVGVAEIEYFDED